MATQQPMSLFGVDPEMVRQQQETVEQQRMLQMAQADPDTQINMMGRVAGRGVGQGLGQMFGITPKNPAMERAAKLKAAGDRARQKGFDPSKPELVYEAMAQELANEGLYDEALQATQQATAIRTQREEQQTKKLTAEYNMLKVMKQLQGKPDADKVFELIKSGKYSPESVKKFEESGNLADLKMVAGENGGFTKIGAAESGEPVYRDKDGSTEQYILQDGKKVPFYGSIRKEQEVNVGGSSMTLKMPKDFKEYYKILGDIRTDLKPAYDTLKVTGQIYDLLPKAVSGKGAAVGALRQQFASLFKIDSQMGKKEMDQISASLGGLPQRLFDGMSMFLTGTITADSAAAMEEVVRMVERKALEDLDFRVDRDKPIFEETDVPPSLQKAWTATQRNPYVDTARKRQDTYKARETQTTQPAQTPTIQVSPAAQKYIDEAMKQRQGQ